ncbi:MAG TPA: hypothetical protein VJK50_03855 [Patescibacteria group bacterium]|nr:hypothetical protein [Patescibacteria group bacterium]
MQENGSQNKEQDANWCPCPNCKGYGKYGMYHYGHKFFLLRILLMLIILGIVFAVGVKIGEFKSEIRGDYGFYGGMGKHRIMFTYPNPMMQFNTPIPGAPTTTK